MQFAALVESQIHCQINLIFIKNSTQEMQLIFKLHSQLEVLLHVHTNIVLQIGLLRRTIANNLRT